MATVVLDKTLEKVEVSELVARVEKLIPSLRERATRIAQERTQPDDVIKDLYDAGLMELMRPRRFGGLEYGVDAVVRVGCKLAEGDGSTSWVYMVTAAHDLFMPLFPEKVQEEYWLSERPVGASSYVPTGKATPADGGYILSGKWSFCSGIDHSGWVLVGAVVGMLDNPVRPDMRLFLIPDTQFKIIDDWYVMGLRGTGSKSVQVDDVFVPNERMIRMEAAVEGVAVAPSACTDPDYKESIWAALGFSLSGPAPGIARTAYEAVIISLKAREARNDPFFMAKRPAVLKHIAEASLWLETAERLRDDAIERVMKRISESVRIPADERVRNRRDSCYSVVAAKKAVDIMMELSGGSGLREDNPVQRALRDVYAISAHPAVGWDSPAASYGNVALGGAPTEMMI